MRGTPAIYFKSLNRPFHIMGVDRQLFFLIIGLCVPIAFSAKFAPSMDILAGILFLVSYVAGVLITRADQQMLAIYRNHIHYKKYYAAQAGIHASKITLKPSVPIYQGKQGLV